MNYLIETLSIDYYNINDENLTLLSNGKEGYLIKII